MEQVIISFQKRLGIENSIANELGISQNDRKADVKRIGKKVVITPKYNQEYIPDFTINDVDLFEKILEEYLETVRRTNIKSTKMDERHSDKYFLFNIWKNATNYDFQNPERFIYRYTKFISDTTFSQYDELTPIGKIDGNILMVKREEDEYGFETPYIMHLSLTDGSHIYNLPWVRYGISENKKGEKIAYIYALQKMQQPSSEEYNACINKMLNKVNSGVKQYRNVTPSAIATLAVFFGMLEKEGINAVKAPDFLIGRYGKFCNAETQEEIDAIQTNLTDKFLRNFLRLSNHFENIVLEPSFVDEYNSFLCMTLNPMKSCSNETLKKLYELGRGPVIQKEVDAKERV